MCVCHAIVWRVGRAWHQTSREAASLHERCRSVNCQPGGWRACCEATDAVGASVGAGQSHNSMQCLVLVLFWGTGLIRGPQKVLQARGGGECSQHV